MKTSPKLAIVWFGIAVGSFNLLSAQSTLETGLIGDWPDIGQSYQLPSPSGAQTDRYAPWVDVFANYVYTAKIDDDNKLKIGLFAENYFLFAAGNPATPSQSTGLAFGVAGKAEPSIEWNSGGLTLKTSFPLVWSGPTDGSSARNASGQNALANLYPVYGYSYAAKGAANYGYATNSFLVNNYTKAAYKFAFDKTSSLTVSAEADFGLVAIPWILDVKPGLNLVLGPVAIEAKYSFWQAYNDTAAKIYWDQFLEPKLCLDFASLGAAGLKIWVASKISLFTTNTKDHNSTLTYLDAGHWRNVWIAPGIGYKFGDFYLEASLAFRRITSTGDAGYGEGPSTASNTPATVPYLEPQVKFSYTFK